MKQGFVRKLGMLMITLSLLLSVNMIVLVSSVQADESGDFSYFPLDEDPATARISNYTGEAVEVDIPDELGGLSIVEISTAAFANKQLTSVTIPNSVVTIDYGA